MLILMARLNFRMLLCDDNNSWPNNLFLDGFVYESIGDDSPKDAKNRIEWLQKQYGRKNKINQEFRPQPYEQLASVLQKSGLEDDAKKILIAKNEDRVKWGPQLTLSEFIWYRIFGPIIGYGYKPLDALWWIGAFILIGFLIFKVGHKAGVIVQTEKKEYEKFNALVYSIEMFVPVLDLYMKKYWIADANKSGTLKLKKLSLTIKGKYIRGYMWIHIGLGWLLTTLLIVGLTGLVKT